MTAIIVIWLIAALIGTLIGNTKGRTVEGLLLGLLLGVIGLIIVAALPKTDAKKAEEVEQLRTAMKP